LRKICYTFSNFVTEIIQRSSINLPSTQNILKFNSEETKNVVTEFIKEYHENKERLKLLRSSVSKEIKVKTDNLDKKMKDISLIHKTTIEDLFSNYYQHLYFKKLDLVNNSDTVIADMFSNMRSKFFNKILKYTNDSVEHNYKSKGSTQIVLPKEEFNYNIQMLEREIKDPNEVRKTVVNNQFNTRNNFTKIFNGEESVVTREDLQGLKNADNNISKVNSILETKSPEKSSHLSLNDSYHSEKVVSVEEKKKKKKYNFFGYSKNKEESLADVYRRIVDLNTLENKIFKHNGKSQEKLQSNNNFSEMYYNIKNKM